jgi:hypothetical protein
MQAQEPLPKQETELGRGTGWRAFAGVMLLIVGFLNFIDALVALTNASYVAHVANTNGISLPATNNIHAWGWIELIFAIVLWAAGASVLSMGSAIWSRAVGVIFAGVNPDLPARLPGPLPVLVFRDDPDQHRHHLWPHRPGGGLRAG